MSRALSDLAFHARSEPGLHEVLGRTNGILAVPEVARPAILAALAHATTRTPLIVAVPTGTIAQQLAEDLAAFIHPDEIAVFPAWETLPFERVSPAVHTMGERVRVLWRLRQGENAPRIIVAGTRALLQKLAPGTADLEPVTVSRGSVLDVDAVCEQLVHFGYRRENVVEHRGEFARRGAIIDVFPSTDDEPVRIDLWGDEVDRLTRFTVAEQRSTDDIETVRIFPARELLYTDAMRERARGLVSSDTWGREQWERLAEGQVFDGMESWLPWLTTDDTLVTDLVGDDALVVLVEPRRMIDRARDLLAEEDDLASALASSWARDANVEFPRLHVAPERVLSGTLRAPTLNIVSAPDAPGASLVQASGWGPIVHDPEPVMKRLATMLADKWSVVVAANTEESTERLVALMADHGLSFTRATDATDVSSPDAVAAAFAAIKSKFGRLDMLFNNAGGNVPTTNFGDFTWEQWSSVVAVNLNGMFLCANAAFRMMRDQDPQGGRVINNGSISAHVPRPGSAAYTSTKHAVTGLTKCISLDGRKYDIACGQIDVGNAMTELASRMSRGVKQANGEIAVEAMMDVREVADAVVHMSSLPLSTNIQFITIMATKMPFVGRG